MFNDTIFIMTITFNDSEIDYSCKLNHEINTFYNRYILTNRNHTFEN